MSDGFNDEYRDSTEKDLNHSNIRQISVKKTAVALKDSEGGQKIPRIAAAGRGFIAEKILELAFENNIKVREDSDLAELLTSIELDSPIPSEAFMAVGEILSYVYQANGRENPFDSLIDSDT